MAGLGFTFSGRPRRSFNADVQYGLLVLYVHGIKRKISVLQELVGRKNAIGA